jgi:MFS family permease
MCLGSFFGPLLLGRYFDTVGRKPMIAGSYLGSGVLLLLTALLLVRGDLTAVTLTACWTAVLFVASCGASSAYLTVSEIFPMETRAMAIAFFYALGTAAGGIAGPLVFAELTGDGDAGRTALAFTIGAVMMMLGGIVELLFGVRAERQSLEDIAAPLSSQRTG